jgi:poly(beta-D-mannuronate) lyase
MIHRISLAAIAILCGLGGGSAAAAEGGSGFTCEATPAPVVSLGFGSRYTDESATRSDIDETSNAEVNKALEPVEDYINDLSRMANAALLDEADRPQRIACVTQWLLDWAEANALTGLETLNAKLAVPARFAGFAIALLQIERAGEVDKAARETIVGWLEDLGKPMVEFFDTEAPPKASRNNLRAWAALAAAAIGKAGEDQAMIEWARQSFELVACDASADGSLPLEMGRADKALNYQLHATAPLVITAALLADEGFDGYAACGGKLEDIARFSLAALKDPALVEAINGKKQTFATGKQEVEPFMMAWAEPFLAHTADAELDAFVEPLRPLSHSKLGGNLTALGDWVSKAANAAG